jgi:hypothetical protein
MPRFPRAIIGVGQGNFFSFASALTGQPRIIKRFLQTLSRYGGIVTGSSALATFVMDTSGILPYQPNDIDFIVHVDAKPLMHHIMYEFQSILKVWNNI